MKKAETLFYYEKIRRRREYMKKVNWRKVSIAFIVYILVALGVRYLEDEGIVSKEVYFILYLINMAAFMYFALTKCRKDE